MSYATNPIDGIRTYFEDAGGDGPPLLVYTGFGDSIPYAKTLPVVGGLRDEFRMIYADHRGQGRSEKPHDVEAYSLLTRVADVVATLDALEIERAHFFGSSWGARLGFAVGEHAPERVRSLALYGNQPYEWPRGPLMHGVAEAVAAGKERGIEALVETWESAIGDGFRFPEPGRTYLFGNDPLALEAEYRSIFLEGEVSTNLFRWHVPCFIYVGSEDEMAPGAARAAQEIPGATFLALDAETHFSAELVAREVVPRILEFFRSNEPKE
ncbi:MAG: alpha/beta hydrolase [Actinomycetota bacterium]